MKVYIKRRKYVIAFIILICVFFCNLFFIGQHKKSNLIPTVFLNSMGEIDDHFLVLSDKNVVFSVNDSGFFLLKTYKDKIITRVIPSYKNVFKPTLVLGDVTALQDFDGNEKYKSTSPELRQYIGPNAIKEIYSFRRSELIIIQMQNDNNVFLIDLKTKAKRKLLRICQKIHGAVFSETNNCFIISYDDKIKFIDGLNYSSIDLANDLKGDKLNPNIHKGYVYFVNNSRSEYYQVFRINLRNAISNKVQLVHQSEHDILMPKMDGSFLYYIEVINSEYILKRINVNNKEIDEITHQGVVYNYDFYDEEKVIFVYADIFTPRCLMFYNQQDNSFYNITGSSVNHGLSVQLIKNSFSHTNAYELKTKEKQVKGAILFIHPGLDFSPRWDAVLMNLCYNGYVILAPNFPVSSGFGKTNSSVKTDDALEDLKKWKDFMLKQNINMPVYCLAASSGNILMERLLADDNKGIKAAASLFGIPATNETSVPILYLLGENDPHVHFATRNTILNIRKIYSPIEIFSYSDEGHWFRKTNNMQDAVSRIIDFFCLHL